MPPPIELSTPFRRYTGVLRHGPDIVSLGVMGVLWALGLSPVLAVCAGTITVRTLPLAMDWPLEEGPIRPVRVDEDGITLDGAWIAREQMRFGHVRSAGRYVDIHDARGVLLVTICVDAETGPRILSQLGIGAAVFEGPVPLRSAKTLWFVVSISLLAIGAGPGMLGALLGLVLVAAIAILLGPKRVVVARDGIFVTPRLSLRRRFVPWRDVVSARSTWSGVRVELCSGALTIPMFKSALLARIEQGLATFQATEPADLATRLARRGRGREAWLRALSGREGDFREAPVPDELLWHVVESPGTPPTARAAAALILTRDASEKNRRRLRIAAEACAEPRLRVVLDEAGKGTGEEALAEALGALDDEADAGRVKTARETRRGAKEQS